MTVIYTAAGIAVLMVLAAVVYAVRAALRVTREARLGLRHAVGERTP